MSKIKRIVIGIGIVILLIGIIVWQFSALRNQKQETERWRNNYRTTQTELIQTVDKLGRTQSEVASLQFTKSELSSELYQTDSVVQFLMRELKLSGVRIKHLEWSLGAALHTGNSGTVQIDTIMEVDTLYMEPISQFIVNDSNLFFKGVIRQDSLDWEYTYTEEILAWVEQYPTLYKKNGERRCKLWIWLFPKRKPKTFIKSTNPRSTIKATEIQIR